MSYQKKKPQINSSENFSKILDEMRNLAISITKNKRLRVKYCPELPTSACNMESEIFEIMLSLTPYPDFIKFSPRLARKILDGDLGHECGHLVLSKPLWSYYCNWVTKIKRQRGYFKLAHEICNLVEDKRINHFIILRYRFDIGKRLLLANLILKDMIDNAIEPKVIQTGTISLENSGEQVRIEPNEQEGCYMMAILCNRGLYEAKCTEFWNKLSPEGRKDTETALKVMEEVKYKRLRIDMIRSCQEIYDLVAKHLKADYTSREYLVSRRGGKIKGKLSEKLKQLLEQEDAKEKKQEEEKEHLKDLAKGSGAGEGTGEEIEAPQPDFAEYSRLLDECKPEISELLNQLKKTIKPRVQRQIFQKRGRIMSPIIPRIYTNSFRGTVRNVYTNMSTNFEKEEIKIGFMFDYSGSVNRDEAQKITTILNEVFGHYVRDGDFAITAFGANSQKVKVFNEAFENTRARIGGISVDAGGTEMSVLLESFLKMFNGFRDIRKVLVIASDFETSDEEKCEELLGQYAKAGIEVYLIGFCSCDKVDSFADKIHNLKVKRTKINEISELPSRFLSIWTAYQK